MTGASLLRADATSIPLADNSVDLIVTSPPYWSLRDYEDDGEHCEGQIGQEATPRDFLAALWSVMAECKRVLKPSGSIFVNLGDKYAGSGAPGTTGPIGSKQPSRTGIRGYNQAGDVRNKSLMGLPWLFALGCTGALAALGGPDPELNLILRAELIWDKPNGLPESVTDRVRRSHEQWFHLTKEGTYYTAVDEIREAHSDWSTKRAEKHRAAAGRKMREGTVYAGTSMHAQTLALEHMVHPLGKLPGSVWTIAGEPFQVPDYMVEDENGWRMMDCGPLWRHVDHRVNTLGDLHPVMVREIDHFAAFPQEWPRRLILGWSPPGICVECGEGRRPVTDRERVVLHESPGTRGRSLKDGSEPFGNDRGFNAPGRPVYVTESTITGYACACPDASAPTRPAIVLDPFVGTGTTVMVARALGRYGIGLDLSADYLRLARWRVFESGHAERSRRRTDAERQMVLL